MYYVIAALDIILGFLCLVKSELSIAGIAVTAFLWSCALYYSIVETVRRIKFQKDVHKYSNNR